jgi:ABC-2 type transport system ATP-binding protein
MLCGLLTPDAGSGSCLGYDIRRDSRRDQEKHVGYMTQRFSFYEDLTIEENLDFIARFTKFRSVKPPWKKVWNASA